MFFHQSKYLENQEVCIKTTSKLINEQRGIFNCQKRKPKQIEPFKCQVIRFDVFDHETFLLHGEFWFKVIKHNKHNKQNTQIVFDLQFDKQIEGISYSLNMKYVIIWLHDDNFVTLYQFEADQLKKIQKISVSKSKKITVDFVSDTRALVGALPGQLFWIDVKNLVDQKETVTIEKILENILTPSIVYVHYVDKLNLYLLFSHNDKGINIMITRNGQQSQQLILKHEIILSTIEYVESIMIDAHLLLVLKFRNQSYITTFFKPSAEQLNQIEVGILDFNNSIEWVTSIIGKLTIVKNSFAFIVKDNIITMYQMIIDDKKLYMQEIATESPKLQNQIVILPRRNLKQKDEIYYAQHSKFQFEQEQEKGWIIFFYYLDTIKGISYSNFSIISVNLVDIKEKIKVLFQENNYEEFDRLNIPQSTPSQLINCLLYTKDEQFINKQIAQLYEDKILNLKDLQQLYQVWSQQFEGQIQTRLELQGRYKLLLCHSDDKQKFEDLFKMVYLINQSLLNPQKLRTLFSIFSDHLMHNFPYVMMNLFLQKDFKENQQELQNFLQQFHDQKQVNEDIEIPMSEQGSRITKILDKSDIKALSLKFQSQSDFASQNQLSQLEYLGLDREQIRFQQDLEVSKFYLTASSLYEQIYGACDFSIQILQFGYQGASMELKEELLNQLLYQVKTSDLRDPSLSLEQFRRNHYKLNQVLLDCPNQSLSRIMIHDLYDVYEELNLMDQYKSGILQIFSSSDKDETKLIEILEKICLVNEDKKITSSDDFELESESRLLYLMQPQIFEKIKNIVLERYFCDDYLLMDRISKCLDNAMWILQQKDDEKFQDSISEFDQFRNELEEIRNLGEVLSNFEVNDSIRDLNIRYLGQSKVVSHQAALQSIKLILENNLIGRRKNVLQGINEYSAHTYNKKVDNLDNLSNLKKLLKTKFMRYFKDEEVCDSQLSILMIERYIDYNKFKEIKIFIQDKKNQIEAEDYDKILSNAVEKYIRLQRNIEQVADFLRRIFELFGDIKSQFTKTKQEMRQSFKLTHRKENILKIIKDDDIDHECINFIDVLDIQDNAQCNNIIKKVFKHINKQGPIKVRFVYLKKKLIKSANFSQSYEKSHKELNHLIFDNEFCNFLIELAPIYIQNEQTEKIELLFDLLFENVTDGDVLANISLQILRNPQLQNKAQSDGSQQQYLKKGIMMSKSPDTLVNLIEIIKNENKQSKLPQEDQKEGVKSRILNLTNNLIQETKNSVNFLQNQIQQDVMDSFQKKKVKLINIHLLQKNPVSKLDRRQFKSEFLKLQNIILLQAPFQIPQYNDKNLIFISLFLESLTIDYIQGFNILKYHQSLVQNFSYVIKKLVSSQLFNNFKIISLFIKCLLFVQGKSGLQFLQDLFPTLTEKQFASSLLFSKFDFNNPLQLLEQSQQQSNHEIEDLCQALILSSKLDLLKIDTQIDLFLFEISSRNSKLSLILQDPNNITIISKIPELKQFRNFDLVDTLIKNSIKTLETLRLQDFFITFDQKTRNAHKIKQNRQINIFSSSEISELIPQFDDLKKYFDYLQTLVPDEDYLMKLYLDKLQDCQILMVVIEFLNNLILSEKVYILMRGFIKSNICTTISSPQIQNTQDQWDQLFKYLLSSHKIINQHCELSEEQISTILFQIVDHINIFVIVEVLAQREEKWREKTILIYFQKLCQRVLDYPETKEFDLAIMKQWIKDSNDKQKVQALKTCISQFMDKNGKAHTKMLKVLIE